MAVFVPNEFEIVENFFFFFDELGPSEPTERERDRQMDFYDKVQLIEEILFINNIHLTSFVVYAHRESWCGLTRAVTIKYRAKCSKSIACST